MTQVICRDGQAFGQPRTVKLSEIMSTSTAIGHKDRSFWSLVERVQNYTTAVELQSGVSFVEARIRDIVDNMISSRYIPEQSRPVCDIWSSDEKKLGWSQLLESPNKGREIGREQQYCTWTARCCIAPDAVSLFF